MIKRNNAPINKKKNNMKVWTSQQFQIIKDNALLKKINYIKLCIIQQFMKMKANALSIKEKKINP